MLIKLLGPKYVVWDKEATIYFKKPGKTKLTARFFLDDGELDSIRHALETESSLIKTYQIDLVDTKETVCATVDKVIHIRKKITDYHQLLRENR